MAPIVEVMEVPPLMCNCTILGDSDTKEAIVVDPGGRWRSELGRVFFGGKR